MLVILKLLNLSFKYFFSIGIKLHFISIDNVQQSNVEIFRIPFHSQNSQTEGVLLARSSFVIRLANILTSQYHPSDEQYKISQLMFDIVYIKNSKISSIEEMITRQIKP